MRTAPAVHVSVMRFGVWRAAVGLASGVVGVVILAWVVAHWQADTWPSVLPVAMVGSGAALAVAGLAAWLVAQARPFDLRWDGRCWHLSAPSAMREDAVAGEVRAAVDVGAWLLLRFVPERRAGIRWLALQRRGLEPEWHALRCAVYSPRPDSRVDAVR